MRTALAATPNALPLPMALPRCMGQPDYAPSPVVSGPIRCPHKLDLGEGWRWPVMLCSSRKCSASLRLIGNTAPGTSAGQWWSRGGPDGFWCPACGGREHSIVTTRDLFQCTAYRRQTSPMAGTIFASTKLPLCSWFRATHHLTQKQSFAPPSKQGIRHRHRVGLGRGAQLHPCPAAPQSAAPCRPSCDACGTRPVADRTSRTGIAL